jgi:hypothetical protein
VFGPPGLGVRRSGDLVPNHQSEHLSELRADALAHKPYDVVDFGMGLYG